MTAGVLGSPYTITPSAAIGTGLGNYTITYATGSLTVNPVALSITADDKARNYGAPDPAFTATYVGLVAGDTAANISGLTLTPTSTVSSPPGTYSIQASGATSDNYTISMYDGVLSIGGSIPGSNVSSSGHTDALEPLYPIVENLNATINFRDEAGFPVADISYDTDLKKYLNCAYYDRDNGIGNSCW